LRKKLAEKYKDGTLKAVSTRSASRRPTAAVTAGKKRGRWDQTGPQDATPAKKPGPQESPWEKEDATPASTRWDETPGRAKSASGAETPGATPGAASTRVWEATPGHATPGHETPGHADKAGMSARRNRWMRPPKTERETPGHTGGWRKRRVRIVAAWTLSRDADAGASKRRSRWDETPSNQMHATPVLGAEHAYCGRGHASDGWSPPSFYARSPDDNDSGTAAGVPMEREIDERNRPYTDDELDSMSPAGYKVLTPPA
ncbi:splicing factor 3B subunit 1-like, partial [Nilaparvata lugens]|uniref:splicing factor 3B subunit 1-like n=1 Tax=Nilaparvata lugens TaxID=108931 RepID=UPI00193CD367